MQRTSEIKKVVTKVKLKDKKTDADYWRKQPYLARLAALEELRREYHRLMGWGEQRMQKVVKIIKFKELE